MSDYTAVVNVLNGEKYLRCALSSIFDQSKQPASVIIVDNASSDGTYQIAIELARRDKRVNVIRLEQTLQLYASRNVGFENVKTKYVAYLDVDDEWHSMKNEIQIEFIENCSNAVLVYSDYKSRIQRKGEKKKDVVEKAVDLVDLGLLECFWKYNIHFSSVLINVEMARELYGCQPFNPELTILGDFEFIILCRKRGQAVKLPLSLSTYNWHESNTGLLEYRYILREAIKVSKSLANIREYRLATITIVTYSIRYLLYMFSKLKWVFLAGSND